MDKNNDFPVCECDRLKRTLMHVKWNTHLKMDRLTYIRLEMSAPIRCPSSENVSEGESRDVRLSE